METLSGVRCEHLLRVALGPSRPFVFYRASFPGSHWGRARLRANALMLALLVRFRSLKFSVLSLLMAGPSQQFSGICIVAVFGWPLQLLCGSDL